jgi:hypothetical protein
MEYRNVQCMMGECAKGMLTRDISRDLAAKSLLAMGYAQFDIVLSSRHQAEDDDSRLIGFLVDS